MKIYTEGVFLFKQQQNIEITLNRKDIFII